MTSNFLFDNVKLTVIDTYIFFRFIIVTTFSSILLFLGAVLGGSRPLEAPLQNPNIWGNYALIRYFENIFLLTCS